MPITTGAALYEFGTQVTVISDAVNAADPQFTVVGDATTLTQTDYTPLGDAVLDITLATAATAGDAVHLYRQDLAIDGANDATFPNANFSNIYVGSFPLDLVATRQYVALKDIPLTISQNFAIEYDLTAVNGTAINATTVKVTPKSYNTKV